MNNIDLYEFLNKKGMLGYGVSFHKSVVTDFLGITIPEMATMEEFNAIELNILNEIDAVRNKLISEGKYLSYSKGYYRVLLPSENAEQCERYSRSAIKKLRKSIKLAKNTPKDGTFDAILNAVNVRAQMKLESLKNRR